MSALQRPGTVPEQYLKRALRLGNAVLMTGAGFSSAASNGEGLKIPLGSELRELLWPIAFPGIPLDEDSSLGDIFDVAKSTAGNATKALLDKRLSVDESSLPAFYGSYFKVPW